MKLNEAARAFIGDGADATLITLNPDGSPPRGRIGTMIHNDKEHKVSLVWVGLQSTSDGDELVTAHLAEHKKVRNVRRDPRVAVTIVSTADAGKAMRPYLAINGTARIVEGGAPQLLKQLSQALLDPNVFPPDRAPPRLRQPA